MEIFPLFRHFVLMVPLFLIEYRTADLKKGYVYRKPNVPIEETLQFFRSFLENQTLTLDADWLQVKAY